MNLNIKRKAEFDVLRGIAVLCMVLANSSPTFTGEIPMLLRALFSIAAPIFVMMSGFMVSQITHRHSMSYFYVKGMFVICVGILMDIFINQIVPLEGFDVLYLIGMGIPITALIMRYSQKTMVFTILVIVAIGAAMRLHFGYQEVVVNDLDFSNGTIFPQQFQWECWLFSGWFPLFPWIGFMLSGALLGRVYKQEKDGAKLFTNARYLLLAAMTLLLGLGLMLVDPAPMTQRHGYAEVFYPTTIGMFLTLAGISTILLFVAHFIQHHWFVEHCVRPLGVGVLGIYVVHLGIISFVIKGMLGTIDSMLLYFTIYLIHIAFLLSMMWVIQQIKNRHHKLPQIVYWFIGR
jgi:hypothetical protein